MPDFSSTVSPDKHVAVKVISYTSSTEPSAPSLPESYDLPNNSQLTKTFSNLNVKFKRKIILVGGIIGGITLSAIIAVIIVFGAIPCSLTKCNSRASTCINRPFYAQCICDWGYAGNGKSHCDECGISYITPNARIIGGVEAIPHSWPFAVLIKQTYTTKVTFEGQSFSLTTGFLCGGTLINHQYVLTASHCVGEDFTYEYRGVSYDIEIKPNNFYPTWESMFTVYVGAHVNENLSAAASNLQGRAISVAKIIKHEAYDDINILNDVALFKLSEIIKLDDNVQIACLPRKSSSSYPSSNTPAWIVGWGSTVSDGDASNVLRNVKINVYDSSVCSKVSGVQEWNTQICAGEYKGGKDSCQGDSGGGLFINETINLKQRYVVSGIVSYGDDCGLPQLPGIYTRTSYFLDWITKNSDF